MTVAPHESAGKEGVPTGAPSVLRSPFSPPDYWPQCWQEAVHLVHSGVAERCPLLLLLAPAGFGKTTFLAALVTGTGMPAGLPVGPAALVRPDASGDWLAPLLAALAPDDPLLDVPPAAAAFAAGRAAAQRRLGERLAVAAVPGPPTLIAFDDADQLADAALRELMMTITEAALPASRTDRQARSADDPATAAAAILLLAGEPDLTQRVGRLLPARLAHSIPRATLPPWPAADIAGFLASAAAGGRTHRYGSDVAARLAQATGGSPAALGRLAERAEALAAAAGKAVLERSARQPGGSTAGGATAATASAALSEPSRRGSLPAIPAAAAPAAAPAADSAAAAAGAGGLSDQALAAWPAGGWPATPGLIGRPLHPAPSTRPGEGAGRMTAKRSSRLLPLLVVSLAVVVAGWAVWSERGDSGPGTDTPLRLGVPTAPGRDSRPPVTGAVAASAPTAADPGSAPPPTPSSPPPDLAQAPAPAASPPAPSGQPVANPPPASAAQVAPIPPAPLPPASPAAEAQAAAWMARGDALLKLADLSAARQFYLLAARRGQVAGLTAAAATYDPLRLREFGLTSARGDADQAIALYRQAIRQGDVQAHDRLWALIQMLRQEGRIDDAEARRLLQR